MHDVSQLDAGELGGFFEADARAFSNRMSAAMRAVIERHGAPERMLVNRDQGEIVATAASEPSVMTLPGLVRAPTAMVVAVSVIPTHRRQGRLRALMRAQLDDLHDRGESLAILTASEGGIYERFGYGVATFAARYSLDRRTAVLRPDAERVPGGTTRFVDRDSATDAFRAVYTEYALRRAGEVDRSEIDYAEALGYDEDAKGRFYVVYEEGGRIDGYASYEVVSTGPPGQRHPRAVAVAELCSLSRAAYVGLWEFLLGIDLVGEVRARIRPLDEPLRWMLMDQRQLRTERVQDHTWVRLVDAAAALRARRYPVPGQLVLSVNDPFCEWNSGSYRLTVAEPWGQAEVEFTPGPAGSPGSAGFLDSAGPGGSAGDSTAAGAPRLELDVAVLGSLYLGGVKASDYAAAGRVGGDLGAASVADQLFANDVVPFSLTSF